MSELRVVNEELSARLTALEESNESLRLEKERLVREQQAAMDRNVQETARAVNQESGWGVHRWMDGWMWGRAYGRNCALRC